MPAPRAVEHARLDPGERRQRGRARPARRAARRDGLPATRRRGRGDRAAGRRPAPGRCRRAARRGRPHRPGRRRGTRPRLRPRPTRAAGARTGRRSRRCCPARRASSSSSRGPVQLEGTRALGSEVEHRRGTVGRPALDVRALGIEPLLLQQRVEDAEVGRRIEPGARDPLPAARVRRQVAVDEVPAIPALAAPSSRRAGACRGSSRRPCACGSAGSPSRRAGACRRRRARTPSRRGTTPRTRHRRRATRRARSSGRPCARRGPGGGAART